MATIVTRSDKGSPLTNAEVDANFTNLNNDKQEASTAVTLTDTQTLTNKTLEGYAVKATSNAASLGAELVTNGTFTGSATGWTLGTNWAYGTNNVVLTLDGATEGDLTQTLSGIETGATYQVSWTQRHSVADNVGLFVFIGAAGFGSSIRYSNTTTNTVVATITASASGSLALKFTPFDATSTGTITIDAVTVKKVTPITACEIDYDNSNAVTSEARRTTAATSNYFEGKFAGQSSYSGFSNVAIGASALKNCYSGSQNLAIGGDALANVVNGSSNTAVGPTALYYTLSSLNVGIGREALSRNSTGANNTGIGYQAGVTDVTANACVSANNCTFIGHQSGFATSTNYNAATAIGYLAKVSSANTVVLGRTTDVTVIGATADDGSGNRLQVTGGIKATTIVKSGSYTVATLPSASTAGAGARAFVTDANSTTFLATAVGGGANAVPVVSNGTSWVIG
jgi:hypothetical protein